MKTSKKWRKPLFRQPESGLGRFIHMDLPVPFFTRDRKIHMDLPVPCKKRDRKIHMDKAAKAAFRLSKKWLAPLFRGFHSSLAPTARPGSYAEKPLLRKAFCGFAVHAAKSDYSLRGLRPPNPHGFFDRLKEAANCRFSACRKSPAKAGLFRS